MTAPTYNANQAPASWQYSIPDAAGNALATYDGDVLIEGDLTVSGDIIGAIALPYATLPTGRLSLNFQSVMAADVIAAGSITYLPYVGGSVPVWNGTAWETYDLGPLGYLFVDLDVGTAPAGNIFDVFAIKSTFQATIGYGPAWTNQTTRAAAIDQTLGLWTNSAAIDLQLTGEVVSVAAHEATYLGSFYTSGPAEVTMNVTSQAAVAGGSAPVMGLYNAYNRVDQMCQVNDSVSPWTTSAAFPVEFNASPNDRIYFLDGLGQSVSQISATSAAFSTGSPQVALGIGVNTSGAYSAIAVAALAQITSVQPMTVSPPVMGWNYCQALGGYVATSGACTYYGLSMTLKYAS